MKVLLATTNQKKIQEISDILSDTTITIITPDDMDMFMTVKEDGSTFKENAIKKATAWAEASGMNALADDSGLCLTALGGRPGVKSARFAGENATDEDNWRLLLKCMKGIKDRGAKFICVVALAMPDSNVITAQGVYPGFILDKPAGTSGFGYDPVFFDPETKKTFAQLSPEGKNQRSHRTRALLALKRRLKELKYI
ncbi:MAG: RdgB/HAM1 family non-canonical purine NTP pyrophosphatase [Thermodesulfobacteriota bacterium]|nr:RdgB/HAM1 family non-canonical purine NTP pyrophosphatase [Thermodesulfobacteriota bacterium]